MKKLLILAALAGLTACNELPPAAAHDCKSMNLTPGTDAYNDCMKRMSPEEGPLSKEQSNP